MKAGISLFLENTIKGFRAAIKQKSSLAGKGP